MKNSIRKLALPGLLALAFASSAAWAQTSMPASSSSSSSATSSKISHAQKHADQVEQKITDLHSQLQITDAQSKQWEAFAQVMRDNATKADQAFRDRKSKLATMTADEAMKSYASLTQMHADDMQKLSSAFSDLYATFSDTQKEAADEIYRYQTPKRHGSSHKSMAKPAGASSSAAPSTN